MQSRGYRYAYLKIHTYFFEETRTMKRGEHTCSCKFMRVDFFLDPALVIMIRRSAI